MIDDTTLNVIAGQQQVLLNFEVPIGNDMQLGVAAGALQNVGLYRNDENAIYPYDIASAISITNSSAGLTGFPGYYYFYYNIKVEVVCEGINNSSSWDCDNQGNCYDPGSGTGQYSSLASCQNSCIVPSWDCDNQGNCYDPGNGQGVYSSMSDCEVECVNVSVYDNGITKLKLFPNPFKGLINIQFINTQKCNLELIIFNSIGESIHKESSINHTGEYRTSINLARYSNSIYFMQIKTDYGIIYRKMISQ